MNRHDMQKRCGISGPAIRTPTFRRFARIDSQNKYLFLKHLARFARIASSLRFVLKSRDSHPVLALVARAIRNAIRANRFARIIRNQNPYFYSASGRFARITRISDSRESPDSRESIRENHATKVLAAIPFFGRSIRKKKNFSKRESIRANRPTKSLKAQNASWAIPHQS